MISQSDKRKFIYKLISFLVVLLTATGLLWAEETAEEKYEPYPILFVHGYNNVRASSIDVLWSDTFKEFKKYFFDEQNEGKYFSNWDYRQKFDYIARSNGDLNDIADDLKGCIDTIIDTILSGREEGDRKVIIVAHSAGGLVTRRLLDKYPAYQDKIEKVIFLGTPHIGSPLATGVILTDRMIPELEETEEESRRWSNLDFSLRMLGQKWAYWDRHKKIKTALNLYRKVVNWDVKVSLQEMLAGYKNPYKNYLPHNQGQGVAVGQIVVPADVEASKTFIGKAMLGPFTLAETDPITKTAHYNKADTFLDFYNFALPNKFEIIRGTGSLGAWLLGKPGGSLFQSLADYTGLPEGNTFEDLLDGDGIVTTFSQTSPGGNSYVVDRCHITETKAWQTILQAIDDKPVIEKISIESSYEYYPFPPHEEKIVYNYVKVKLKDYLLADIEIVEMVVNDNSVDLSSFLDPETNTYKPYYKYKDKDFLRERTDKTASFYPKYSAAVSYLTLEPGEFWVRIDDSQVYNVFLKVKNPAEKESSREVCFLYDKVCSIFRGARAMGFSSEGWSWYSVKEAAYSSLLASEKLVVDPSINLVHSGAAGSIGCIGCSQHLREEVYDEDGNTTIENLFRVSISWCYSQWAAFKLNTVSQDIESIKLCLFIKKPSYNTDEFGNILFYHDTSNSWPPMSNSSADKLLLSCSCETTDYMEIDIDPRDINADGYYIIEYKPAFQEYNCIPAPLSSDDELYCCIRKCNVGFYHLEVELKEDE